MRKPISSQFDIGLVVAAVVISAALAFANDSQLRARPEDSVARLFSALAAKDLAAVQGGLVPVSYDDFLRTFGEEKFLRVQRAFDLAYRLGDERWSELRQRANGLAAQNYDQLHVRVTNLGKEAFAALPVDERMKFMDDQDSYAEFLYERGVAALSSSDRARIGSATEFRLGQDRGRFLEREGFDALSAEDQAVVGRRAALSDAPSDEKFALHDKFGLPLLSRDVRAEIGTITRADLQDAAGFKLKYGEPLARSFLQEHAIPAEPGLKACTYPWVTERGSLIRGDEAICEVALQLPKGTQAASIVLVKQGFEWRVARISPALTEIGW